MGYQPYVDSEYYLNTYKGSVIPEKDLQNALRKASRHIDTLTYNRIVGRGFDCLTEYQQEIVRDVICQQADFEYENAEVINTVLQSYGINGVSMQFGETWNVKICDGIAMGRDAYALLSQTGLTCRLAVGK